MSHDAVGFYLLSQEVAKHVKVAQSGQGADEIFGGYHWYPTLMQSNDPAADYARVYFDRDHDEMGEALAPALMNGDYSREFVEKFFDSCRSARAIDKTLQLDAQIMMVDDPVKRVDNMAMAWGLETRVPFLDHEVVELAARIPAELKVRDGGKYILKEASRGLVPDEVIDRPKGYFPVPALKYLRGPFYDFVRDVLDAPVARQRGLFNRAYVDRLLANPEGELTPKGHSKLWQVAFSSAGCKPNKSKTGFDRNGIQIRSLTSIASASAPWCRRSTPASSRQTICSSSASRKNIFCPTRRRCRCPTRRRTRCSRLADCGDAGRIGREFLQAQIEVATEPHSEIGAARHRAQAAAPERGGGRAAHGLTILACGTHPSARWPDAVQSPKDRYTHVMDVLQMIGQRNMLCGMHVHVEFPDPARRVDVMTRMLPYLPLFIALSTSSPFWQGRATGLKGYRLAAYDELPRTGLPELFRGNGDYDEYVAAMMRSGAIKDASHLWWAIRPSLKYPTLELRAPDCCTRLDDAIALAALYRVLRATSCRYRAQCGSRRGRPLHRRGEQVAGPALRRQRHLCQPLGRGRGRRDAGRVLDLVAADAAALGCAGEVEHCRKIAAEGTSAEAQVKIFTENEHEGADIALHKVARWIP